MPVESGASRYARISRPGPYVVRVRSDSSDTSEDEIRRGRRNARSAPGAASPSRYSPKKVDNPEAALIVRSDSDSSEDEIKWRRRSTRCVADLATPSRYSPQKVENANSADSLDSIFRRASISVSSPRSSSSSSPPRPVREIAPTTVVGAEDHANDNEVQNHQNQTNVQVAAEKKSSSAVVPAIRNEAAGRIDFPQNYLPHVWTILADEIFVDEFLTGASDNIQRAKFAKYLYSILCRGVVTPTLSELFGGGKGVPTGDLTFSIAVMAIFFLSASPASAYLDPGTGSLLLQGVIGAIAGLLVALKLYWTRVKKFFAASQAEGQDRLNDVGGDE